MCEMFFFYLGLIIPRCVNIYVEVVARGMLDIDTNVVEVMGPDVETGAIIDINVIIDVEVDANVIILVEAWLISKGLLFFNFAICCYSFPSGIFFVIIFLVPISNCV